MSISSKVCQKCNTDKPAESFHRCAKGKGGLQSYCIECSKGVFKKWASENKEHLREKNRNREYVLYESQREWHRLDYLKNKEKILKRNKAWAERNPLKVRELSLAGTNRRKVRELSAEGSHTEEEWHLLVEECNWKCVCCGDMTKPLTKDHIIPLIKGGSDYINNIQPLCRECNSSKRDRIINYLVSEPTHVEFV